MTDTPNQIPKYLTVEMPDGSVWGVPVDAIAKHRAAYYADEFGGDIAASLEQDTLPLFRSTRFEIQDWAVNNMNWSEFETDMLTIKLKDASPLDFDEAWNSGKKGYAND